jgi:hemerythrin-like metal-binding protein
MEHLAASTNVLILDEQHQVFFDILKSLKELMLSGQGMVGVPALLCNLAGYARFHFPTEENLMERYKYPLRDSHGVEHRLFIKHLRKLLAIIRKRRFLDFGRAGGVAHVAELEAQVREIAAGSRMVQEFVNNGLEVGQ